MLGLGETGKVRASATAGSARSRDSYQRYAVALYRQALLTPDDDAYATSRGRGGGDARSHLAESVFRRCYQLVAGPARQDRRLLRTVLRRLATSPAAAVEDGDQAGGAAAGGR
jgi:hypothetical protein